MFKYKLFIPVKYKQNKEWRDLSSDATLVFALLAMNAKAHKNKRFYVSTRSLFVDMKQHVRFNARFTERIKKGLIELNDIYPLWVQRIGGKNTEWIANPNALINGHSNLWYTYVYDEDFQNFIDSNPRFPFVDFNNYVKLLLMFPKTYNEQFAVDGSGIICDLSTTYLAKLLNCTQDSIISNIEKMINEKLLVKKKRKAIKIDGEYIQPSNLYARAGDKDLLSKLK